MLPIFYDRDDSVAFRKVLSEPPYKPGRGIDGCNARLIFYSGRDKRTHAIYLYHSAVLYAGIAKYIEWLSPLHQHKKDHWSIYIVSSQQKKCLLNIGCWKPLQHDRLRHQYCSNH